jgi:hypothetical protein
LEETGDEDNEKEEGEKSEGWNRGNEAETCHAPVPVIFSKQLFGVIEMNPQRAHDSRHTFVTPKDWVMITNMMAVLILKACIFSFGRTGASFSRSSSSSP